jgi:hypothetical protein
LDADDGSLLEADPQHGNQAVYEEMKSTLQRREPDLGWMLLSLLVIHLTCFFYW